MRLPGLFVLLLCAEARADNYLVGPVLGVRLGGPPGSRAIFGIEGGAGYGPERFNLGFTRRLEKMFSYVEVDPWFVVGASLGAGIDSDGNVSPVIGIWEGMPISNVTRHCDMSFDTEASLAVGYRYTGVHELYMTVKAGLANENWCL